MQRSIIQIYAAAVCFVAAICMSIAAGIALYSLVQLSAPPLTSRAYQNDIPPVPIYGGTYQVNPALVGAVGGVAIPTPPPPPSPAQLREARERARQWAIESERTSGVQGVILWGIVFCVSGVLWALHWRILRRERAGLTCGSSGP